MTYKNVAASQKNHIKNNFVFTKLNRRLPWKALYSQIVTTINDFTSRNNKAKEKVFCVKDESFVCVPNVAQQVSETMYDRVADIH